MLHESILLASKSSLKAIIALPFWLKYGKAQFKHRISQISEIDAPNLPYNIDVLSLIKTALSEGRPVFLTTAASNKVAQAVAQHLGVFDAVFSSDELTNLTSKIKAQRLVDTFGERGFDYIGDSKADLAVFARARRAYLISSRKSLRQAVQGHHDIILLDSANGGSRVWGRALRLHQWLKNLLVFVPLLAAHQATDPQLLLSTIIAFLSFSACASSVYLLNDLLDLPADRKHNRKKTRPFAAGELSIRSGLVAIPLLLAASIFLALQLPPRFIAALGSYYMLTLAYSFFLKKQVIVDVMLLASLYTLRIIAGSVATDIKPSFWLLTFSMFVFLSLALVKRYSELRAAVTASKVALTGRGYHADDLPVVLSLGSSSGMVSVLILAMYTQAEIVPSMYAAREWLWLAPPLMLYWTARLWMKAARGEVNEDPVIFAAKDWQSLTVALMIACTFLLAMSEIKLW